MHRQVALISTIEESFVLFYNTDIAYATKQTNFFSLFFKHQHYINCYYNSYSKIISEGFDMSTIEFSLQQKEQIISKLQKYFLKELDSELEQFDADFLLDFIAKEMGVFFYNKGLYDAQAILNEKLDTISDAIYEIEQPIP